MTLAVVVAAGGAAWESQALEEIETSPVLHLKRRCLDLAEVLALSQMCDVAVVSTDLAGLGTEAVASLERDGVRVVAIGDDERARRLGIGSVVAPGSLHDAVATIPDHVESENGPDRVAPDDGRVAPIVAVWGPHGAPGRSVVASSIAALAASARPGFLVDADPRGGSLAQMFALLDDVSGLVAACRNADRGRLSDVIDDAVPAGQGLRVLTGVPRADMWSQVRRGPFERVLKHLAERGSHVVVDTGPGCDDDAQLVLSLATRIVVVGRADPVGLARLVRSLHELKEAQDGLRRAVTPVVVVNQLRSTSGWSRRDIDGALFRLAGVAPDVVIDADYRVLDTAALRGQPPLAVDPSSPFVAGIARLVEILELGAVPAVL